MQQTPNPILICSQNLENIFEMVLKCIVNTVPRINQFLAVISLATDGDTNRRKTVNLLRYSNEGL